MKKGGVQSSHLLESVVHFVIELVKMQCSSPILFLYCLKKLWMDRTLHHIQMIALLVESLGPLMLYIEEMQGIMNKELDDTTTLLLIVHELLAVPIRSSLLVQNVTILAAKLAYNVPRLGCMLIDQIYERIFCFLDAMARERIQEITSLLDLVGMMFEYSLFSEDQIVNLLYLFIEYGHIVSTVPRFSF